MRPLWRARRSNIPGASKTATLFCLASYKVHDLHDFLRVEKSFKSCISFKSCSWYGIKQTAQFVKPPFPLALSRFLRRGMAPACKNRSAAPAPARCFVRRTRFAVAASRRSREKSPTFPLDSAAGVWYNHRVKKAATAMPRSPCGSLERPRAIQDASSLQGGRAECVSVRGCLG